MAKKKAPQQAAPLDYSALMASARGSAAEDARAQMQALIAAYPQLEALQLGTIGKISGNLDNQYTKDARAALGRSMEDTAGIRALGQMLRDQSGPTAIERSLQQQAENELALGRQLSAEEMRDAAQSARAAFAARGLASSMPSVAAEILNRDQFAQARESARRNFASGVNQMVTGNVFSRMGQAANTLGAAGQMDQQTANQLPAIDPYFRALGHSNIGAGITGNLTNMMGQTFGNAQQMAGNVASFNANMLDSRYNSYMNNRAAMNAANMQAGAMNRAATMGMIGQIGSSIFSDERMKKDIKPVGKAGSVLGLTAYEYRYKGEAKDAPKRVGFMAQEVKKVLPEAVEEVEHQGKKRLTIKPAVIGAAIAEQLSQAKAA